MGKKRGARSPWAEMEVLASSRGVATAYRAIAICRALSGTVHLVRAILIYLKSKPGPSRRESA